MPKNRTFAPHAAKALTQKLWYLKDQETTATTARKDRQERQKAVTTEDHLQTAEKMQKTRINPITKRPEKDTAAARLLNAVLFHQAQPIKKVLHYANLIAAALLTATINRKEVTANKPAQEAAKANHIPVGRALTVTAPQKEVLKAMALRAANLPAPNRVLILKDPVVISKSTKAINLFAKFMINQPENFVMRMRR